VKWNKRSNYINDKNNNFNYDSDNQGEIKSIALGSGHALAVTKEGRLISWGKNKFGQLGNGTNISHTMPTEITSAIRLEKNEEIKAAYAGPNSTAVLTTFLNLYTFGDNGKNQLGFQRMLPKDIRDADKSRISAVPRKITDNFPYKASYIKEIGLSRDTTIAVTGNNEVYTWGSNQHGELGNNESLISNPYMPGEITSLFNLKSNENIIKIKASDFNFAIVTSLGRLFVWGSNREYLGLNNDVRSQNTPLEISEQYPLLLDEKITNIALGDAHTLVVTSLNRIFTCGRNDNGQLGDEFLEVSKKPIDISDKIKLYQGELIVDVSCGYYHNGLLTSNGRFFVWGNNLYGQLGNNSRSNKSYPLEITPYLNLNEHEKVMSIMLGDYYTFVITSEGRVYSWGCNDEGQLGDGTKESRYKPICLN
jgi:alpha-tubulin suppressor-like RCC1 family protein